MIDLTDEQSDLLNRIRIGIRGEQFLNSEIGQYLVRRATVERKQALEALSTCKYDALATHQEQARVAVSALQWLVEAIEEGKSAEHQLDQLESTDD